MSGLCSHLINHINGHLFLFVSDNESDIAVDKARYNSLSAYCLSMDMEFMPTSNDKCNSRSLASHHDTSLEQVELQSPAADETCVQSAQSSQLGSHV